RESCGQRPASNTPAAPTTALSTTAPQLTGADAADAPLGNGTALIMGTSGNPAPPQAYLDAIDALYLAPRGFGGSTQLLVTPEALYPFTGVESLPFDTSEARDEQILDAAILKRIAGGQGNAAHPVVVSGWSHSTDVAGVVMPQ